MATMSGREHFHRMMREGVERSLGQGEAPSRETKTPRRPFLKDEGRPFEGDFRAALGRKA
jgi:hypothetical protein